MHRARQLSDGRGESPPESVSRLVRGQLHLPVPDPRPVAMDERGIRLARLDYSRDKSASPVRRTAEAIEADDRHRLETA